MGLKQHISLKAYAWEGVTRLYALPTKLGATPNFPLFAVPSSFLVHNIREKPYGL